MDGATRKPLARVTAEAEHESMVMWPMRWPPSILDRVAERAKATKKTKADVVREAVIAGLISLETQELMRLHNGKTA